MKHTWLKILILFGIFILAFLPRSVSLESRPTNDELWWTIRSFEFFTALVYHQLAWTNQSYHPGVTTMWVGFLSWGKDLGKYMRMLDASIPPTASGLISTENLRKQRLGIALVTTFTIIVAFYLLWELLGFKIALIATCFIAYEPLYLARSRLFHTGALETGFLTITMLTFLLYLEHPTKRYYLILSGLGFGLACLSRNSALIFALYVSIPLTLYYFLNKHSHPDIKFSGMIALWTLCLWATTASLTFMGLWPALWVGRVRIAVLSFPYSFVLCPLLLVVAVWSYRQLKSPGATSLNEHKQKRRLMLLSTAILCVVCIGIVLTHASQFWKSVAFPLGTPHEVAHVFMGRRVHEPGPLFYPTMLTFRITPPVLLFSLLGVGFPRLRWRNMLHLKTHRIFWLLLGFVLLYTACLSVGAKKLDRYLLAAFPLIDTMAAISLCYMLNSISKHIKKRLANSGKRIFFDILLSNSMVVKAVVLTIIVLCHVIPSVIIFPNYGQYHNPMWNVINTAWLYAY